MDGPPLLLMLLLLAGLGLLLVMFLVSITWVAGTRRPSHRLPVDRGTEWEVLRTYTTTEQAYLDRAMLEGCGIPIRLANEHTVGNDWLYGIAVGVDLHVPKDQLESAELLLRAVRVGDASVDIDVEGLPGGGRDLRCDRCGSTDVYRIRPGVGWALATVVLLGLPLLRRARYQCDQCGSRCAFSNTPAVD